MTKHAHAAIGALAGAAVASLVTLAATGPSAEREKPGIERWPIKTGADPVAKSIPLTPTPTTLHALVSLPRPDAADGDTRVPPVETTCYTLRATLTAYKEEADGDEHLALADGGETMIAEIPRPDFLPAASPWKAQIGAARAAFVSRFHPSAQFRECSAQVVVTGIGFFDHPHSQRGVAANAVEIHPVLSIGGQP